MPNESESNKQKNSLFANWTINDSKLLMITITATVVANMVTIIMVAMAIIVARSFRPKPATPQNYIFLFWITPFLVLAAYGAFSSLYRKRNVRSAPVIKWALIIVGLGTGFLALLYVLAWIGFALGVK